MLLQISKKIDPSALEAYQGTPRGDFLKRGQSGYCVMWYRRMSRGNTQSLSTHVFIHCGKNATLESSDQGRGLR
jgi:hypothetical protein